ncbi:LPXTG cell wall anchor domain-containing protein [Asanoa sp. WMMD1127]|uniref:LPXTG cell wall anchor domain-containing protein n=1 Tax=Asanoa sp. WMMD1127 TaxID=3016107 RepID=UPI002416ACF4|nr:LPXTG cell wall anchor domain-containing protein [Asanoa sp. WMMD1127]MDG4825181.1 LPXTG cell wall anchor domain-containing protein [Asanoa sp. WMMD1127]
MRWKIPAGVLVALAFLIPAAPALAQTERPGLNESCQTVERKEYKDIRELMTIDLDAATDVEIRVLANQILAAANTDSLAVLPGAIQERLDGTPEDLRAFLKENVQSAWSADLRLAVFRTLTDAGTNVQAAADDALKAGTIDAYLAYLNVGLWDARALDCAAQPTPTPTATPTAVPTPVPSGSEGAPGEGGGLPVTGANTAIVAAVGGALLLLGGMGYVIGRRRRSRFVA